MTVASDLMITLSKMFRSSIFDGSCRQSYVTVAAGVSFHSIQGHILFTTPRLFKCPSWYKENMKHVTIDDKRVATKE